MAAKNYSFPTLTNCASFYVVSSVKQVRVAAAAVAIQSSGQLASCDKLYIVKKLHSKEVTSGSVGIFVRLGFAQPALAQNATTAQKVNIFMG